MHDLRELLAALRAEGDLLEIEAEADPNLEIPEIHRRVIEQGGPALLFKRPRGSAFPVVTNLFGTAKRIDLALSPCRSARPGRWWKSCALTARAIATSAHWCG